MFSWLRELRHRLSSFSRHRGAEASSLTVGSTGSGKSEGELVDLVRLAGRRDYAVVLLDGHGPLALRAAGHWAARGHEDRLVYEPLEATERVLCWHMLPRSTASGVSQRLIEDAETREEVAQCFLAQRNLDTLTDRPWTKEWLEAAISLCLAQPGPEPLGSLTHAFDVGSADYERLLGSCTDEGLVAKFRAMERLKRKNEVQYEIQTGPGRRLVDLVCGSEVVRLRSRPGPFDWLAALRQRKLVAFSGGGLRTKEIKRALFLLVSLQVIQGVRRHFAETQKPLPVVLVLEEAGALSLVTPFVLAALQELRKAGLAVHLITQSSVDFGDRDLFQAILTNTPTQAWYQCLSPADQELGARALANATFSPLAVHYARPRVLPDGATLVTDRDRGLPVRHTRYRRITDHFYKTPQLHEQEYKTALASLRVGERLVRDRGGVRREQVRPVRAPWFRRVSDDSTRTLIERLRRQPIYQPQPQVKPAPADQFLGAAARLREQTRRG
jgi:hypothetical protein